MAALDLKIRAVLFAGASALTFVAPVQGAVPAEGQVKLDAEQPSVAAAANPASQGTKDTAAATAESTNPGPTPPPADSSPEASKLEEITVTGSRLIIRNGLDSQTPLTSVTVDDMAELHPGTIGNELNDLPIFDASRGQSTNAGNGSLSSSPTAPNPSANVLNLRNMGYQRTLILFDGKRVPPTSPDGAVDINMIPQLLLQRVETVTGGASAVYGSDAMTGVVNFITDTKFTGLKVNVFSGLSHDHDDFTNDEGVAWGKQLFDGRGHFEVSVENRGDPQVLLRSQRQWGRDVWTVQGLGTTADPFRLVDNTRISSSSFGGLITNGVLSGQQFASNGVLSPFVNGAATGTNGYQSGGDGAYYNSSFKASQQLDQLFARLDYDFTDAIHGDVSLAGTYNQNSSVQTSNVLSNVTISSQDAFLSPAYQSELAAADQSTFKLSKVWNDVPPSSTDSWERQYFANADLQGEFGGGYHWDAWYTHAETRQTTRENDNLNNQHLAAALDAVVDPATGQTVCNVTLTNPGLDPGCAPLNVFGPSSESQAAINYILAPTQFLSIQTMDDVSASVTGEPFRDWAGPVNMALSAEWRKLTWELDSDATPTDAVDCTGLRYNCNSSTLLWADGSTANRSPVSQRVGEGALEFNMPLLSDVFLAKDVSVNGAARYTDYDTSGMAVTWKGGLDWKINDELTLRATRSKDIRAPNLDDLYLPKSLSTMQVTDLLTNTNPLVPLQGGGNPNLKPEVGFTTTAGFVYRPEWLPHFSLTLDGYWIDVTNAIISLQGTNPTVQAICYASGGTSPYCGLQKRPDGFTDTAASNAVTEWFNEEINIANQLTRGADLEANYATEVFTHPLKLRFFESYQPHLIQKVPGLTTVDLAGVAFYANAVQATPVYRWTMTAMYSPVQNFMVDVMERWRSSLAWTPTPETQVVSTPRIPSVGYTDLTLSYLMNPGDSQLEVFLNIQNLLNKQPPPAAYLGSNGAVGQFGGFVYGDDPIGAYFTLGVRLKL